MDFFEIVAAAESRLLTSLTLQKVSSVCHRANSALADARIQLHEMRLKMDEARRNMNSGTITIFDFESVIRRLVAAENARNRAELKEEKATRAYEKAKAREAEANERLMKLNK